jgi:hypothetical protein
MELQDTYLRLDQTIADFFNYLDKTVGRIIIYCFHC